MGLYDQYRLQNSTTVPMFTGTTAPEALEVGKHMQALYDIARTGAGELDSASENLVSMEKDKKLADEVMGRVKGDIDKWSKEKDWENKVEDVRALGRYYANRSGELAAPLKQYQEYAKGLDAKDLNLTPEQKNTLLARAKAGYTGLTKTPTGKLTGSFNGIEAAENINMVDWAEKVGKDFKPFKNATKIDYVTGTGFIVTKGDKTEIVTEQQIQDALGSAMAMDTKMQAFLNMESQNAEFNGSRIPVAQMPDTLPNGQPNIYKQQAIANAQKYGTTPEQEFGKMMGEAARSNIANNASQYLRKKYAYSDTETTREYKGDPVWMYEQQKKDAMGTTALVTDTLDNPAVDFENIETDTKNYKDQQTKAIAEINTADAIIKKDYDATHGAGSWDKLSNGPTGQKAQAIQAYFNKQPGGATLFDNYQRAWTQRTQADDKLRKIDEMQEYMDNYVLHKKYGTNSAQLSTKIRDDVNEVIGKLPGKVRVLENGQWKTYTGTELNKMLKDSKFIPPAVQNDMDTKWAWLNPSNWGPLKIRTVSFKTPDGRKIDITENAVTGKLDDIVMKYGDIGKNIAADKKAFAKEALDDYAQSTLLLTSNNKNIQDLERAILKGEKKLYNSSGIPVDDPEAIELINAGDYEVMGISPETKGNQNMMIKISVRDSKDKDAKPTTYKVGVNSNVASMLAKKMMEESIDKTTGKPFKGQEALYHSGLALLPNSAYNKITKSKYGKIGTVEVREGDKWVPLYEIEKGRDASSNLPTIKVKRQDGSLVDELGDQLSISGNLETFIRDRANYRVTFK